MPDSADAFFNDFSTPSTIGTTGTTTTRQRPPPPQPRPPPAAGRGPQPPPPRRAPPPAPPRPAPGTYPPSTVSSSSSYYGNPNTTVPAAASNNYGPGFSTTTTMTPPSSYEESPTSNDWYTYTPSATDHTPVVPHSNYGMVPPLQQPQLQSQLYAHPSSNTTTTSSSTYHPYSNNPSYLNGSMDTSGRRDVTMPPHTFVPQQQPSFYPPAPSAAGDLTDFPNSFDHEEYEAPLLEELGVNWEHIMMKTKAVVIPFRRFQKQQQSALTDPSIIVEDADLAGPLAYALLLGGELLITGKLQFGYIYGFGLFGCLAMTLILNLMSPTSISFWSVTSILGYALIPVNLLAAMKIVLFSFATLVQVLAIITVVWSTTASTRLLEIGYGLTDQRYLLAYPIALLYSAFVLITIF